MEVNWRGFGGLTRSPAAVGNLPGLPGAGVCPGRKQAVPKSAGSVICSVAVAVAPSARVTVVGLMVPPSTGLPSGRPLRVTAETPG